MRDTLPAPSREPRRGGRARPLAAALLVACLLTPPPARAAAEKPKETAAERLRRLREQLRNRHVEPATTPAVTPPATPPATREVPVPTATPAATAPGPGAGRGAEELDAEDLAGLNADAQSEDRMDLEVIRQGGFAPLAGQEAVALTYDVPRPEPAEYLLEIQAMLLVPGRKEPLPHRRIYTIMADQLGKDPEGRLEWEYRIVDARQSNVVMQDKGVREVLVRDEEEIGSMVPLLTDARGVEVGDTSLSPASKVLEWLRLSLPAAPRKRGFGWRNRQPRRLGSEIEYYDGLYLLHRTVTLDGGRRLAVVRGRFRSSGIEQEGKDEETRFGRSQKNGQDRVLFDLDGGRVLYREFRLQGAYLKKSPQGSQAFQARIKGLLLEKSLLEGLQGTQRIDRLNAASAVFGG